MEEFLAVVDAGQLTAAADALYMSQSALSKKMSALSRELGTTLFTKTKDGLRLTPTGWEFYAYARKAVRDYHDVLDRLAVFGNPTRGTIRVGSLPLSVEYGIEDAISSYWADNPSVEIDYHERSQDNLITDLNLRKLDVAIARIDLLDAKQYDHTTLCEDYLVVACHKSHPLARKRSIPLASLRNEQFVLLKERSDITKLFLEHCAAAGFYPNSPMHHSRHRMVLKATSRKMGITVLPRLLVETYFDPEIVIIPFDNPIKTSIGFVWLHNEEVSPLMDGFMLAVKATVSDM